MKLSISEYLDLKAAGYSADDIRAYEQSKTGGLAQAQTDTAAAPAQTGGLAQAQTDTAAAPAQTDTATAPAQTDTAAAPESQSQTDTAAKSQPVPATNNGENETQMLLRQMLGLIQQNNVNSMSAGGGTAPVDPAAIMATILGPNNGGGNNA